MMTTGPPSSTFGYWFYSGELQFTSVCLHFLYLDWRTMCLGFTGNPWLLVCFQFLIRSTANTLTENFFFFCTCSALRQLRQHYFHQMLCVCVCVCALLIIILSDGSCNASSCNNYCDCCVFYANYCCFKQSRKLTLGCRILTHQARPIFLLML